MVDDSLKHHIPHLLEGMRDVVNDVGAAQTQLVEMLEYQLATGGKRLRALLTLEVAHRLGHDPALVLPFACACEMIHQATLVHDDIQDLDEVRRGMSTVWKRYGVPRAIDLGDAMLYYAVLLVQRQVAPMPVREKLTRLLTVCVLRIVEGQESDLRMRTERSPTMAEYRAMASGKTASLFGLALAGASVACQCSEQLTDALSEVGLHLGLAFQMTDDLLDLYGDKGREAPGRDIAEGKRSALVLHALRLGSSGESERMMDILDRPRAETSESDIRWVMQWFRRNGVPQAVMRSIREECEGAMRIPLLPSLSVYVRNTCRTLIGSFPGEVARQRSGGGEEAVWEYNISTDGGGSA
jgi:geranylgeranyl pyrophosphate synthase